MGDSMDINITIENCIFSFNCTQKWIGLDVTVDKDIKFCRKCEKKVYLCKTDEDLNLNVKLGSPKPILLKIAPDLSNEQLDDIVEIARTLPLDGIIATNTTISRNGLKSSSEIISKIGAGGLSGKPITAIGASLHISHNTMKTHLKNVYRKLGAAGRDQAVEKAKSLGLI